MLVDAKPMIPDRPSLFPSALEKLVDELAKLPTIGRKSALRLALHLLKCGKDRAQLLSDAVGQLHSQVGLCENCGFLSEAPTCSICRGTQRDGGIVCVVEDIADVLAIERAGIHRGHYHVLHGHLSPLQGILPEDLNLASLIRRVAEQKPNPIREVIIATNPTTDGDATAHYVAGLLASYSITVTRLAYGISNNSLVEASDDTTLARALSGRTPFHSV